jgi:hypothetical protein
MTVAFALNERPVNPTPLFRLHNTPPTKAAISHEGKCSADRPMVLQNEERPSAKVRLESPYGAN